MGRVRVDTVSRFFEREIISGTDLGFRVYRINRWERVTSCNQTKEVGQQSNSIDNKKDTTCLRYQIHIYDAIFCGPQTKPLVNILKGLNY